MTPDMLNLVMILTVVAAALGLFFIAIENLLHDFPKLRISRLMEKGFSSATANVLLFMGQMLLYTAKYFAIGVLRLLLFPFKFILPNRIRFLANKAKTCTMKRHWYLEAKANLFIFIGSFMACLFSFKFLCVNFGRIAEGAYSPTAALTFELTIITMAGIATVGFGLAVYKATLDVSEILLQIERRRLGIGEV